MEPAILIMAPDFTGGRTTRRLSGSIRAKSTGRPLLRKGPMAIMRIAAVERCSFAQWRLSRIPHAVLAALASLCVSSLLASDDDECEVDECITCSC